MCRSLPAVRSPASTGRPEQGLQTLALPAPAGRSFRPPCSPGFGIGANSKPCTCRSLKSCPHGCRHVWALSERRRKDRTLTASAAGKALIKRDGAAEQNRTAIVRLGSGQSAIDLPRLMSCRFPGRSKGGLPRPPLRPRRPVQTYPLHSTGQSSRTAVPLRPALQELSCRRIRQCKPYKPKKFLFFPAHPLHVSPRSRHRGYFRS